jgi:hypothetical protein
LVCPLSFITWICTDVHDKEWLCDTRHRNLTSLHAMFYSAFRTSKNSLTRVTSSLGQGLHAMKILIWLLINFPKKIPSHLADTPCF